MIDKKDYKKIGPFKGWVLENFPFIEADFDAITNYQLYCKIVEYLNKVIYNELLMEESNNELVDAFNSLKTYVDNYFENLDIQEEINNKLDEMAESGELTDIIAQYLELAGILAYNTASDLANAANLSEGSFTKIYGKTTYNDGYGAFYKIRALLNTDVIDGDNLIALVNYPTLVAEKMKDATIDSILEDINNIEQDINNIEQDITNIEQDITNIEQDITNIENNLDKLNYSILEDKKILVIGDSISNEIGVTALNWVKWIRNNFPVNKIDNISYNGALLTGAGGQAKNYADNITEKYDIIIVALGTNDAYHQATLNTLSFSDTDYNTFNGSLTYLYNNIVSKNPEALVYYICPPKNNYDQHNTVFLDVYRTYIYKACNMFGWTFIDAGHFAPLNNPYNTTMKNLYLADGVHPTEAYAPIYGRYIVNKIISNGDSGIGDFQSRIELTSLLETSFQEAGATLFAEYRSNGNVKLVFQVASWSMGSGIAIQPTTQLPAWCRPYSQKFGLCMIGTSSFLGRVTGGAIQLFPNLTTTGGLYFECEITHSMMAYTYESQV